MTQHTTQRIFFSLQLWHLPVDKNCHIVISNQSETSPDKVDSMPNLWSLGCVRNFTHRTIYNCLCFILAVVWLMVTAYLVAGLWQNSQRTPYYHNYKANYMKQCISYFSHNENYGTEKVDYRRSLWVACLVLSLQEVVCSELYSTSPRGSNLQSAS